jgi:hypothetical protein
VRATPRARRPLFDLLAREEGEAVCVHSRATSRAAARDEALRPRVPPPAAPFGAQAAWRRILARIARS